MTDLIYFDLSCRKNLNNLILIRKICVKLLKFTFQILLCRHRHRIPILAVVVRMFV